MFHYQQHEQSFSMPARRSTAKRSACPSSVQAENLPNSLPASDSLESVMPPSKRQCTNDAAILVSKIRTLECMSNSMDIELFLWVSQVAVTGLPLQRCTAAWNALAALRSKVISHPLLASNSDRNWMVQDANEPSHFYTLRGSLLLAATAIECAARCVKTWQSSDSMEEEPECTTGRLAKLEQYISSATRSLSRFIENATAPPRRAIQALDNALEITTSALNS